MDAVSQKVKIGAGAAPRGGAATAFAPQMECTRNGESGGLQVRRASRPHLLMIAGVFPPTGGSGVQRTAKFAKYLSRAGWSITVLAVEAIPGLPQDFTLLCDLPSDVRILRGPSAFCVKRASRTGDSTRTISALKRLASRAAMALGYPDELLGWVLSSFRELDARRQEPRPDLVFSTYSPPSNHLLGLWLKRAWQIPWAADFRDLWTEDCAYPKRGPLGGWVDRRLENAFLREADAVIAVGEAQRDILAAHVSLARDKFHVIPNGFDPEDFAEEPGDCIAVTDPRASTALARTASSTTRRGLRIAHIGRLQRERQTAPLLEAFRLWGALPRGPAGPSIELRLVGHVAPTLLSALTSTGLAVSHVPHVTHAEAIREMREADLLLLPTASGRNAESLIPAKLFEYLAAGRPILMVATEGHEAWRIARAHDDVIRAEPNAAAIVEGLRRFFESRRDVGSAAPRRPPEVLAPWSRPTQADRLGVILEGLLECSRSMTRNHQTLHSVPDLGVRAGPFIKGV